MQAVIYAIPFVIVAAYIIYDLVRSERKMRIMREKAQKAYPNLKLL